MCLYPDVYYKADASTKQGDVNKLGTYTCWVGKHFYYDQLITICNAYTQYYPNPKTKPFDYDAYEWVLNCILKEFPLSTIAMPKIGFGLAGGNWNIIEEITNRISEDREISVYVF